MDRDWSGMNGCRSGCRLGNEKGWGTFWEGEDGERSGNTRVRCRILDPIEGRFRKRKKAWEL